MENEAPDLPILHIPADQDQFGEQRGLGMSTIAFKLTPRDAQAIRFWARAMCRRYGHTWAVVAAKF